MAIVTRDKDFLRLAKSIPHNGIVYLTKQLNAGAIVRELEKETIATPLFCKDMNASKSMCSSARNLISIPFSQFLDCF